MSHRLLTSAFVVALVSALPSAAQKADLNKSTGAPGTIYHGSAIDDVNLTSGNLKISIPLLSLPGRGLDTDIVLTYNSKIWKTDLNTDPMGYQSYWTMIDGDTNGRPSIGWGVGIPRMGRQGNAWTFCVNPWGGGPSGCWSSYFYGTWITNDGTRTVHVGETPFGPGNPGNGRSWSFDGSYSRWVTPGVVGKDGVAASYSGYPNFISKVKDTNGNFISCTPSACTDTLGRVFNFNSTDGVLQSISYVDSNGATKLITFTYETRTIFLPWAEGYAPLATCWDQYNCAHSDRIDNAKLLKAVTLPNGRSYEFEYLIHGDGTTSAEVTKLKLPTGGYIRYTYGWATEINADDPMAGMGQGRAVATRTVSADGTPEAEKTWTYSVQNTRCQNQTVNAVSTITDPFGNTESHTQTPGRPIPATIEYRNSSGTLLRTVSQVQAFDASTFSDPQDNYNCPVANPSNPRVISRTTTLHDSGLQSYEILAYGAFGNVTARTEGGFGNASRTTSFGYWHTTNTAYADPNVHIVDRVASQVVSEGGVTKAQTSTTYDGALPASTSSSVVQHDYASHPTSYNYRGNPTSVSRWRNTPSGWLTTTNVFNDVGNVLSTTDPGNHTTTFSYTDNFYNYTPSQPTSAFVTQTTMPQTGGVSHIQKSQFYFHTGLVAASCGQNFSGAACARGLAVPQSDYVDFQYDGMNRPTITKTGDGGQTTLAYNEASLPISTSVTTKITSSQNKVETVVYDGLGRTKQAQLNSDPQGTIFTDTSYDELGRKSRVSNPYRSMSETTFGETRFCYDAQGRVVTVTPPDGTAPAADCSGGSNLVRTTYFGNQTTVTDQAGKQRRSFTDALGRLIQVDEPGGGGPATGSTGSATVNSVNPSGGVQEHNISAIAAIGSVMLSGTEQSTQSQTQSATQSAGSVTVNGAEQSMQELVSAATVGSGWVTISGAARYVDVQEQNCYWGWDSEGFPMLICEQVVSRYWDYGGVSITVNGFTKQVSYGQTSTADSIASGLAAAFNNDIGSPVNASAENGVVYLTSKTAGASTNYSLSATSGTGDSHFSGTAFPATASGSTLTGGANAQYQTVYDSGTVTVTVNQGGGQVVATANFGSSSTASSIAADLRGTLNASSLLVAGGSGTTINLTSEAAGASTNYTLATSWTYNTAKFASPSFTASKSGNNMTGGSDAQYTTIYDSGTVTITVNGVNKQVSYGQGSSTSTIASALATAIANDGSYPATASANGATVNLTARTAGTVGNGYALAASTTYNSGQFAAPSFGASKSGNYLSGGVAGSIVYDTGTVTLTIAGCTPFTVNYSNGSTRDSVAAALRSAVNASGPCAVTAGGSGTSISLTSDATGSGVNFALSTSGTTNYSQYFGSPSFSLATSGMSGGADAIPMSLTTPAITAYTYDVLDNLLCVEQRGNVSGTGCSSAPANDATSPWRVRRFTYNSLSQLLEAKNPESGTSTYAYDNDGNLLTKVSPRPNQYVATVTLTTTFEYDELHRMKRKYFTGLSTPEVRNFYDGATPSVSGCSPTIGNANGIGQRTAMCDGSGFSAWTYDAGGSPLVEQRKTGGITRQTTYQYNEDGSIKSLQYPGSATLVTYGYDSVGRAISATGNGTNYVTNAKYAPGGALCSVQNGSGAISTFTFNNRMQPNRAQVTTIGAPLTPCDPPSTSPGNILDFSYGFNLGTANNGNVASIANNRFNDRSQTYTYDELNRVLTGQSQASSGAHDWGLRFGYDTWANLKTATVTKGDDVPMLSVGALPNNRMDTHCYDAAGNVVGPLPCGTATHTYDAENRIVTTGGVTYSYDGDGRRVAKSNDKIYWYGGAGDQLVETNAFGTIVDEFVFFGGKRAARRVVATGKTYYYFADHLGTSRVILEAGQTTPCYDADYYPFGGERVVTDTCPQNYKFTGKERDTESGFDYFGARYYASSSGRFLSVDPENAGAEPGDPQSWNAYSYALNNPVKFVDPNGESATVVGALIGGILGAANAVLQGRNAEEVVAAAAGGAVAGALVGSVIDTGGASAVVMAGAGGMGAMAGGHVERSLLNQSATPAQIIQEGVTGTISGYAGAKLSSSNSSPRSTGSSVQEPHPSVTQPYVRPNNATTPQQRASVQGKPCVECDAITPRQVANHKTPLVKEYYQTGKIDPAKMKSPAAVNSHCPSCSAETGGKLSAYSKEMKKIVEAREREKQQ